MNTLESPTVSAILARLLDEADASDAAFRAEIGARPAAEREALFARARSDYRGFYGDARSMYLAVSRETGRLLYMLARSTKARSIVEFGTSFGVSTIFLAAALKDNGGGRLIGTELEPSKAARARENLTAAGLAELAEIREGDALESLGRDLPESIDLVLLDGAKVLYPKIFALLEPHLAPGAIIVADNADASPEYLERVRAPRGGYVSVPFAADVEVSLRAS